MADFGEPTLEKIYNDASPFISIPPLKLNCVELILNKKAYLLHYANKIYTVRIYSEIEVC